MGENVKCENVSIHTPYRDHDRDCHCLQLCRRDISANFTMSVADGDAQSTDYEDYEIKESLH